MPELSTIMQGMALLDSRNQRINLALAVLLLAMAVCAVQLIGVLKTHQTLSQDRAELKHVKYGMLNADNWVAQITRILENRLGELELTEKNRAMFKRSLERILDAMIVEADRQMRIHNQRGDWFDRMTGSFRQAVADSLVDLDTIRASVPTYAEEILQELEKPESRAELNSFLSEMVAELTRSTFADADFHLLKAIHKHYGCDDQQSCEVKITARIEAITPQIHQLSIAVLGLAGLIFYCALVTRRQADKGRLGILALSASVLMFCGVLTPMIVAEARITEVRFMLLDEPIVFADEIFYFQSKSVLDVVSILMRTREADMMLVGVLITTFCLIFPLAKLLASFLYMHLPQLREGPLTQFFALKSGKWSMADVLVVAIFMAYIGFEGLISSQLSSLDQYAATVGAEVLSTNGTQLQIGFFMFLAFCILNLLTSSLIESAMNSENSE